MIKTIIYYLLPIPLKNIYEKNKIKYSKIEKIYIIFNIVPRIILVVLLLIDIFIFKKIEYFYACVIISLIPLCHRYIKYSFQTLEEDIIYYLQIRFENVELQDNLVNKDYFLYIFNAKNNPQKYPGYKYHEKICSIKEYFDIIKEVEEQNHLLYRNLTLEDDFLEKISLIELNSYYIINYDFFYQTLKNVLNIEKKDNYDTNEKKKITEYTKKYHENFDKLLIINNDFKNFMEKYNKIEENFYIKYTLIIIYVLYFISWSYILYRSFHTVNDFFYFKMLIELLQKIENPHDFF